MTIAHLLPLLQAAADAAAQGAQGAAQVAQAASQFETNKELGVAASQIPIAFWVVWVMEKLKKSNLFPWITQNSSGVNRILGLAAALLSSAGINWSVQGSVFTGGVITITLPALGHLIHFLAFDMARSYGVQQMFYRIVTAVQVPTTQTPLTAVLVRKEEE